MTGETTGIPRELETLSSALRAHLPVAKGRRAAETCLSLAASLTEHAAFELARDATAHRVSDLILMSAKLERAAGECGAAPAT